MGRLGETLSSMPENRKMLIKLKVKPKKKDSIGHMMEKNAKIYVAGHRGMVGSAIVRELKRQGYTNIITRTHAELDLKRQDKFGT